MWQLGLEWCGRWTELKGAPGDPLVYPHLPAIHADTNLGAAMKGLRRSYEGPTPADFVRGRVSPVGLPSSGGALKRGWALSGK